MHKLFNTLWKFKKIPLIENDFPQVIDGKPIIYSPVDLCKKLKILESNDDCFEPVTLPHDYLIFDTKNLYENSVGCYRKTFFLNDTDLKTNDDHSKQLELRFEGVYMNSAIWINDEYAGEWKYGYTTFEIDISKFVKSGLNTVNVVCVYQSPNSRWYSGAGIYRDVYLVENNPVHIASDGIYIRVQKENDNSWIVTITTEVTKNIDLDVNCITYYLRHVLKTKDGKSVDWVQSIIKGRKSIDSGTITNTQTITVTNPKIWDVESPDIYILETELFYRDNDNEKMVIDSFCQNIGFKTIRFDCNKGLFLNERHLKIHGACMHHDLGALGAAFNLTALKRQFKKLKEMGVNSIRASHNPSAPAFMDLADEMGFLIISEGFDMWEKSKTPYDYGNFFNEWCERDTEAWIRRDRNHPCLLAWSIGNEIYDTHQGNGLEITRRLSKIVRRFDSDKNALITIGSNYMEWDGAQSCAEEIDLVGYNYGERLYEAHHKKHPKWCIYGSETSSTIQSREIYHFPASQRLLTHDDLQCSSLGNCSSNWGAKNTVRAIIDDRDAEYCWGQYVWTGWDYIGEPTPYFTKNSYFGQIDTAGYEKDTFFLYRAEWTDWHKSPFIHILPYWDFNDGQLIDVRVYSNAPMTELFFNNKSLGSFKIDHLHGQQLSGEWRIPYEKGCLRAVACAESGVPITDNTTGKVVEDIVQSFGDSTKIALKADKTTLRTRLDNESGGGDLVFVTVSCVDSNDIPVANARNRMKILVTGGAVIEGVDNGDSTDYEQYKCPKEAHGKFHSRKLFNNRLTVILAPEMGNTNKDDIVLSVSSPGLPSASLKIELVQSSGTKLEKSESEIDDNDISVSTTDNTNINEIPVRKIEMIALGKRTLSTDNKSVVVEARILPKDATHRELKWRAVTDEAIQSNAVKIQSVISPNTDTSTIEKADSTVCVEAMGDGEFRLWCYCDNGSGHPEVISELEFSVTGMGQATVDPYRLVNACTYSECLVKPIISFQGGVYVLKERNRLSFNQIDFGDEGSDEITLPIFSFDTELPIEIWDGIPDNGGNLIAREVYKSPSWYNHYQANTWKLPTFLTGVHTISILTETRLSLQGFQFTKKEKAFARHLASESTRITGDMFKTSGYLSEFVSGIGNNVSLEFSAMNFGDKGFSTLAIFGRSNVETTTIHIKFESCELLGNNVKSIDNENRIVEFEYSSEHIEKKFSLVGLNGKWNVTFLFLPGSNFDFGWFQFM